MEKWRNGEMEKRGNGETGRWEDEIGIAVG
jgi:hypothetical protein